MTSPLETIKDGLKDLEQQETLPIKLASDAKPLFIPLNQLREDSLLQTSDLAAIEYAFAQAGEESARINIDLKPELVGQKRRAIKEAAITKAQEAYRPMVERRKIAEGVSEFYEPNAVLRRGRLADSEAAHHAAVASWTARLTVTHPAALLGHGRFAVAAKNIGLTGLALEIPLTALKRSPSRPCRLSGRHWTAWTAQKSLKLGSC
jgi:hypothetical protein